MSRPVRPRTEDALLLAARAVFQKNPGATLDDVAAAAGVGRATLFRHFKGRAELQRAVLVRALAEVKAAVRALELRPAPGQARAQLVLLLRTLLAVGGELRFILSAADLFEDPAIIAASAEIYALVDPVFARAIEEGVLRADMPLAWLRAAAEAVLYAAWFEVEAGTIARAEAPGLVEATILGGIGRPPAAARAAGRARPRRGQASRTATSVRSSASGTEPGASR